MENGGGGEGVAERERSEEFFAQETQGSCKFLSQQGNSAVNQKAQWERFYKTWEPVKLQFSVPCVGIRIVSWVLVLQKTPSPSQEDGGTMPQLTGLWLAVVHQGSPQTRQPLRGMLSQPWAREATQAKSRLSCEVLEPLVSQCGWCRVAITPKGGKSPVGWDLWRNNMVRKNKLFQFNSPGRFHAIKGIYTDTWCVCPSGIHPGSYGNSTFIFPVEPIPYSQPTLLTVSV